MRSRVRACQRGFTDIQSIWINDSLLARAFHRFNRVFHGSCKRHGSNIPGPLEAQRRLAKRKMGLVSNPGSSMPLGEFGALWGPGYQPELQWKWEPPSLTPQLPEQNSVDDALLSFPPPVPSPQSMHTESMNPQEVATDDSEDQPLDDLRNRLSFVQSPGRFAAITSILQDYKEDGRLSPMVSQAVFSYLAERLERKPNGKKSYYFTEDMVPFMLDTSLNVPEARNLDSLLDLLSKQQLPNKIYSGLLGILTGLVRTGAIELSLIPGVCRQVEALRDKLRPTYASNKFYATQKLAHLYKLAWRALTRHATGNGQVPDPQTFADFHDVISTSRFLNACAPKLRERLMAEVSQAAFPTPDYIKPEEIEKLLRGWVQRLDTPAAIDNPKGTYALGTDYMVYVFNSLPNGTAPGEILAATKEILASEPISILHKPCFYAALRIWATCIVRSAPFLGAVEGDVRCWETVELLAPLVRPTTVAYYLNRLDARQGARFLMHTWVKYRLLNTHLRKSIFPIEPIGLHEHQGRLGIEGHSSNMNKLLNVSKPDPNHQSALDATLRSHQAELPSNGELVGKYYFDLISTKCEEYLSRHPPDLPRTSIKPYMDLIAAVAHTGLSYRRLMVELFRLFMHFIQPIATAEGIHHVHDVHGIRTLRGLAAALINHYTTHDPVEAYNVFRLVHTVIPAGLRPDFLIRLAEEGVCPPDVIFRLALPETTDHRGGLLTPARIDLLHQLADAWGRCEHLRPLVAARWIYRLYAALRDRAAPLDARLSRALIRAAVIRPLREGDWVGTLRFRRVLDAVRAIEGERAAARLDALVWRERGKVLWERRGEYPGVKDEEACEARRKRLVQGFQKRKAEREREMVQRAGRGGDGDFDPYRFWKSVPEGEEVDQLRFYYTW